MEWQESRDFRNWYGSKECKGKKPVLLWPVVVLILLCCIPVVETSIIDAVLLTINYFVTFVLQVVAIALCCLVVGYIANKFIKAEGPIYSIKFTDDQIERKEVGTFHTPNKWKFSKIKSYEQLQIMYKNKSLNVVRLALKNGYSDYFEIPEQNSEKIYSWLKEKLPNKQIMVASKLAGTPLRVAPYSKR